MLKRLASYAVVAGFVLITSGVFSAYLLGLKSDREEVLARMGDVSAEYEKFNTNVSLYGDYREDLHESIFENLFFETMYTSDKLVKDELAKYEGMVDEMTLSVNVLDDLCKNIYYPKSEVNNMCNNYKTMYEQVVNYFVYDINDYNANVDKYNEYEKANNLIFTINRYETSKKYIDYNGDNKFAGKEE